MYLGKIVELGDRNAGYSQLLRGGNALSSASARPHEAQRESQNPAYRRRARPAKPASGLPISHPLLEGTGDLPHPGTTTD